MNENPNLKDKTISDLNTLLVLAENWNYYTININETNELSTIIKSLKTELRGRIKTIYETEYLK